MSTSSRAEQNAVLRLEHLLGHVGLRVDEVVLPDTSDVQDQVLHRKSVPRRETWIDGAQRWVRRQSISVSGLERLLVVL